MSSTNTSDLVHQVIGTYAHLNQKREEDLDEAIAEAIKLVYYDDPLHLAIPYNFFMEMLPEPPDGILKSVFFTTLILFVYLYLIICSVLRLWMRLLGAYISQTRNNLFVRHGRKRSHHTYDISDCIFNPDLGS